MEIRKRGGEGEMEIGGPGGETKAVKRSVRQGSSLPEGD